MRTQNSCRGLDYGHDLVDRVGGVLLVVEAVLLFLVLFLTVSGQTSSYDLQNRHNQPDLTRMYAHAKRTILLMNRLGPTQILSTFDFET
jgi:hypothetical protein